MPGLGRYPCKSCHYVASNRRLLARHCGLIHKEKVFKCPVCPFVTRYATNCERHKRDQHGLSKNISCVHCDFSANSPTELSQHQEAEHHELLQLEALEDKYAKERTLPTYVPENKLPPPPPPPPVPSVNERDYRNDSDVLLDIYDIDQEIDINLPPSRDDTNDESVRFSLPFNGQFGSNFVEGDRSFFSKDSSPDEFDMNGMDASSDNLRPLRIRRSYNCDQCGLLTNNPREYLYHLRNVHGENISVHECKYCIYASKHIQKLVRHCNLVHRQQLETDLEYKRLLELTKDKKSGRPDLINMGAPMSHSMPGETYQNSGIVTQKLPMKNKPATNVFKCSVCAYQTRNKALLFNHEKTAHVKKSFRCNECGYSTNDKNGFSKHIKYHNLPKMQCEFCFFKTAYKWNMERHMKNHEPGAEGSFHCNDCNFTTTTKQSFNAHITNHHDPSASNDDQECHDVNEDDDSNEWEDITMNENEDDMNEGADGNFDSYEFSEMSENPDNAWNHSKYERNLKCQQCDFRAAWPFELKKHEENHRSQKKHPCPLCGMRFEHVAWLTKHLRRIHGDDTQATNMAAAYDLMKPTRRRTGKPAPSPSPDTVLPMYQEVLQHNNATNSKNYEANNSMLSTLLKKPLHQFPQSTAPKYGVPFKSKPFNPSTSSVYKQPKIPNFFSKDVSQDQMDNSSISNSKKIPTCNICGYKTRWVSELQRHMRVHSQEKPFQCHKCKYVCKWKGDLNRHLIKYHGIKVPKSKANEMFSKYPKSSDDCFDSSNDWQMEGGAKRNLFPSAPPGRSSQESPLDLTLCRETFPHPNAILSPYDTYDLDSHLAVDSESDPVDVTSYSNSPQMVYPDYKTQVSQFQMTQSNGNSASSESPPPNPKMKYQCPSCHFSTTTVSRFHVHVVQHFNKRPFMCSVCGYNSNWEYDITKHIKVKGCKDKDQNKACILMTDECGKRNYAKYEKYLVDITQPPPVEFPTKLPDINGMQEPSPKFAMPNQPNYNEASNKSCSYDFRNIGSNFEDPVSIVVTPDINLPEQDMQEQDSYMNNMTGAMSNTNATTNSTEPKSFYCKHCNFKHSTKRVVVSHLSSHAGLKPFRCRACGMVSNWRHVIVRHVKDVHNGYMNEVEERINYVQEGFGLRVVSVTGESEENSKNTSPEKPAAELFGCQICPYKCDKEFYMNFHMKQHKPREGAIFKCDHCPYYVKFKKTLVRHMKLHSPSPVISNINENVECENNQNQPQSSSNDIYDFYNSPDNSNDSNDESIAISFNQLNQIEESPSKIKRHICEHCPYKTDNKTQFLYHKQFHRPNPTANFKCTDCSYWASMQHLLTQHMKVHTDPDSEQNETPHKDGPRQQFEVFDEKNMPETISIIYVQKGDENVKMFKCEFCPMMNKKKANVRVHQKMHGITINDGKFACIYCNYQCLNQGGLTNHMKVHQRPGDNDEFPSKKYYELDEDGMPIRKRVNSYFCYKCPAICKTANDLAKHSKFHGCDLPLKCTYCDYRVKQKPHITQHLNVHTAAYKEKRKNANPMNPQTSPEPGEEPNTAENKDDTVPVPYSKKIDQMLLLEASELQAALSKTGEAAKNLQKCIICPATFCKNAILVYHVSLHGSDGIFKCSQCDYAVNRIENFAIHREVHPKKSPVKRNLKSYACTKCPAIFYKPDRLERHLELHGKNYRFVCDYCDYSVRFAANLIKHKKIHGQTPSSLSDVPSNLNEAAIPHSVDQTPLSESTNFISTDDKVTYICDKCPYFQPRKDAVQAHLRRHGVQGNFSCPYCDYSCVQGNFLQSHIRFHVQPNNLFPPQAFMKYESFKIYIRDENNEETLLFDDDVIPKPVVNPIVEAQEKKLIPEKKTKEHAKAKKHVTVKKMKELKHVEEENANQAVPDEEPNFYIDRSEQFHTDSNFSNSSSRSNKVPIVVLNDIFAQNAEASKINNKLTIPKLKISRKYAHSSSPERSIKKQKLSDSTVSHSKENNTKAKKPSLVVKIKVENCRINKHEKTLYSVSTKSSDPLAKDRDNSAASGENTNDSTSDLIFQDTDTSVPITTSISPVNDIEENTLTSNPDINNKVSEIVASDTLDSVAGSAANDTVLPQSSDELKSPDSFSNDTVPVVTDVLCGKLECVTELSFKDNDINLTNGDCSDRLVPNRLGSLQEEIKVVL